MATRMLDQRIGLILLTAFIALAVSIPGAGAQSVNTFAHVWGRRERSGGYRGSSMYMNYPNPSISSGWTAGPNAVSNLTNTFIESGPIKDCNGDCKLHPYGSWKNASGGGGFFVDTTARLGTNVLYRYKTVFFGGTGNQQWQSQFCSGNGCRGMITGDLGVDKLPYVLSGGESSDVSIRWGSAKTSHATYFTADTGKWFSWCYTFAYTNVDGTVSKCDSSNYSWVSTY